MEAKYFYVLLNKEADRTFYNLYFDKYMYFIVNILYVYVLIKP